MLKLYNTLTRKKEVFIPIQKKFVRMYTCGPTVYNFAHIGNFRSYLLSDMLRRYLEYVGYKVKSVMNITDVDDKTIRDSKKEGMGLRNFTHKYIQAFFDDIHALRIKDADAYPRATEHIKEMTEMIKLLIEKGLAYKSEDSSVYFSIERFRNYGKLSHLDIKLLRSSARVSTDEYTKEQATDFALWKAWDEKDGDVFWDTELGKGRPGWHIECSVMSIMNLGQPFDIHTGGIDLMFPHHENEIAQSEGASDMKFVNFWVHGEHLLVNGKKMAKVLGNFFTLRDITDKKYDPAAFRYLCLSSHYRSQMNFTFESLNSAANAVKTINDFVFRLENAKVIKARNPKLMESIKKLQLLFEKHMNNDLDTPNALKAFFGLMPAVNKAIDENKMDEASLEYVIKFVKGFDFIFDVQKKDQLQITEEGMKLIEEREQARRIRNFSHADAIREELKKKGIMVEDTPNGPVWRVMRQCQEKGVQNQKTR